MLKEYKKIRQEEKTFRRLFTDDFFDLYIWYPDEGKASIVGFQLVYRSGIEKKALTWTGRTGFFHTKIDEGDKKVNQSPILVQDGVFEYENVAAELEMRIGSIDGDIRKYVLEKIREYGSAL